jgi:anti-sigma factor RsiW
MGEGDRWMSLSEPFDDRLMADIAAAADGTLDPARRAEIEAMAAADAELAAALERQRRAVALIRGASAEVHAPPALRARLEEEGRRAARDQRLPWLAAMLAGGLVVLLALVLAVAL